MLCSGQNIRKFSEPLGQLKPNFIRYHHGIGEDEKFIKMNLGHLMLFILVKPQRAGAFSKDFNTNLALQCRAFSRAMKVSKGAKIRNRYNQVPHLTQDTNRKVTNS